MGMWQVALAGSDHDLSRIASLSQAPTWSVHERDGRYVLEADTFALLSDPETVRQHARDYLLPVINGVARLTFGGIVSGRVEVGTGVDFEGAQGQCTGHRFVECSAVISVSETTTVTVLGGPGPVLAPPSPSIAEVCTALLHQPEVGAALDFFACGDQ